MYRNPYAQFQPGGIWEGLKRSFRRGTALTRLIYVNVGFFLFLKLVEVGFVLAGYQRVEALLLAYTGVPALPEELLYTPWTIVTYMFTHFGFLHLLFNMLWLYWFGSMFLNYFSGRKLVWVYVFGGLFGALLYMAAYSGFPVFGEERYLSRAIGASASVMAVVFAVCAYLPNHRVYVFLVGPVRLITLALFTALIDVLSIPGTNAGGHIAHLGGALFGVLFTLSVRRSAGGAGFWGKLWKASPRKPKMKVKYKRASEMTDREYNEHKRQRSDRINEILDKISKSGYGSLTKEEKELLFKERR